MGDRALRGGRLADGRRQRQRPGSVPDRSRGGDRSLRVGRSGALRRDRGGHGVAPDRCRWIAGGDLQTQGARPTRHRRCAPDHITGVPRHPRGVGRARSEGSQAAIAGRARMRLPFARWRAASSVLEIGPTDLAMDKREAVGLGRELGLRLPADTATRLTRETEGWPALLALAMLGAGTSRTAPDRSDAGPDHRIDDYLRSEVLDRRSTAEVTFLTRTSILDDLPAPLCDVVADRHGSTEILRHISRSTLLIDEYGGSYRYHTLLRDFLQRELAIREPQMLATLHRRAATWYQANDAIEHAVDHAFAAEDSDLVATLVGNGFGQLHWSGHRATIRAWARRLASGRSGGPPLARRARSLGGDRRGRRGRDDTTSPMSPSEERSRVGRTTAPRLSSPGGRCSEPRLVRRGAEDALANPTERSSSKGTMDRGGTSRYGSWPSRASRSAMWWAQTQPLPTQSSRPGRRATSRACTALLGHRALVAAQQGAWDAAAAYIAESGCGRPGSTGQRVPLECPVSRCPHRT